jgi:NAD(P)-dependent dehydrogenase (short-subunit alcohol dehydrogenase family)
MRLKGKVALVTGASRGIGRGIALALVREGAKVVVNYSPGSDTGTYQGAVDRLLAAIAVQGGDALPFAADVSKKAQVEAMVEAAIEHYGQIDILVNNAGICPARDLLANCQFGLNTVRL